MSNTMGKPIQSSVIWTSVWDTQFKWFWNPVFAHAFFVKRTHINFNHFVWSPPPQIFILIQVSKESVRSQAQGHLSPHSLHVQQHIPPVLITSSPNSGSRIIRQSSQPEASNVICCQHAPSLRQLRDPSEGIAGIAADSLRINGAMRPFRQVRFFNTVF